jgi:hypothetical protein
MKRLILVVLAFVVLMASEVSAKRFKMPRFIPIPGGSHVNGTLVRVKSLPSQFEHEGQHFDLGYYWPKSGRAGWVGYISSSQYVSGHPGLIEELVVGEGISLPDVPDRPSYTESRGGGGLMGGFFGVIALVACVRWLFRKGFSTAVAGVAGVVRAGTAEPETPAWQKRAEAKMAATSSASGKVGAVPRGETRTRASDLAPAMAPGRPARGPLASQPAALRSRGLAPAGPQRQAFGRR